LSSQGGHNNLH